MRIQLDKIASVTRNVPLHRQVVLGTEIPAKAGTVVAVRVLDEKTVYNQLEDVHGRMMTVHRGDVIVGVLGERRALKGYSGVVPGRVAVGDVLHLLNLGGVIGACTSWNPEVGPPNRVEILGSVLHFREVGRRVGEPASIFPGTVALASKLAPGLPPAVYLVGTSMSAGKTGAACALVREFTHRGLRVGVAKVTGVALRRDTLEMLDHGAVCAYTFADTGLPSTCQGEVIPAAKGCLNAVAQHLVDVMVIELGDGLLGEYGVMDLLSDPEFVGAAGSFVLAANDPVGAWGGAKLIEQLELKLSAVTGPATDNEAGCTGIRVHTGAFAANARKNPGALADRVLADLGLTRAIRGEAPVLAEVSA